MKGETEHLSFNPEEDRRAGRGPPCAPVSSHRAPCELQRAQEGEPRRVRFRRGRGTHALSSELYPSTSSFSAIAHGLTGTQLGYLFLLGPAQLLFRGSVAIFVEGLHVSVGLLLSHVVCLERMTSTERKKRAKAFANKYLELSHHPGANQTPPPSNARSSLARSFPPSG